ncbi:hypothetical protein [Telluribacter sp.]|uniref:hypothetical protein n=1 Tax=Telluribacter sp. TaxID=1978767 RepID=UPI0039C8D725
MEVIWEIIEQYEERTKKNGFFDKNRQNQNLDWLRNFIRQELEVRFLNHPEIKAQWFATAQDIQAGKELPLPTTERLLKLFFK